MIDGNYNLAIYMRGMLTFKANSVENNALKELKENKNHVLI